MQFITDIVAFFLELNHIRQLGTATLLYGKHTLDFVCLHDPK